MAEVVEVGNGLLAGVGGQGGQGRARLERVTDMVGNGTAENDNVEERVGTEAVGA